MRSIGLRGKYIKTETIEIKFLMRMHYITRNLKEMKFKKNPGVESGEHKY